MGKNGCAGEEEEVETNGGARLEAEHLTSLRLVNNNTELYFFSLLYINLPVIDYCVYTAYDIQYKLLVLLI